MVTEETISAEERIINEVDSILASEKANVDMINELINYLYAKKLYLTEEKNNIVVQNIMKKRSA